MVQMTKVKTDKMSDTTKLEFLTPTDEDKFEEKEIAPDVFKIDYEGETLKVKMTKASAGTDAGFELLEFPAYYDRKMKKLIGYAVFKLVPRYK